jgi:hypothetical protein
MNLKGRTLPTVEVMLLSAMTVTAIGVSAASTTAVIALSSYSNSDSYSLPGSTSQDIMPNLQLGDYSYEITRISQYFNRGPVCYGHKAKQAKQIMDDIERVCGALVEMSYPARKPAGMLLRESNYFGMTRDHLLCQHPSRIRLSGVSNSLRHSIRNIQRNHHIKQYDHI